MGRIASLIVALVVLTGQQPVRSQSKGSANGFDLVDNTGNIRKPADVRDLYQSLGVYTPVDLNNNTEMHYTYATPGTAEYYRKTGKFEDGTVLVKEVFATDHAQMTTGDAHWATATKVWFVMIKDDKNRYPNNPLWGDGWGWALFKADAPEKQVATNYKKDCLGCHVPAQSTDWVYVQGYPVLKSK
jgi:Cytochrome P460